MKYSMQRLADPSYQSGEKWMISRSGAVVGYVCTNYDAKLGIAEALFAELEVREAQFADSALFHCTPNTAGRAVFCCRTLQICVPLWTRVFYTFRTGKDGAYFRITPTQTIGEV